MGTDIELAVLFSDVVGSTRIYEAMGDQGAREVIALCIDLMQAPQRKTAARSSRPWAMR